MYNVRYLTCRTTSSKIRSRSQQNCPRPWQASALALPTAMTALQRLQHNHAAVWFPRLVQLSSWAPEVEEEVRRNLRALRAAGLLLCTWSLSRFCVFSSDREVSSQTRFLRIESFSTELWLYPGLSPRLQKRLGVDANNRVSVSVEAEKLDG